MKKLFYSFSTNYEDLVLSNALNSVPANEVFWIDIGANDPIWYSNTAHFAFEGGRGINCDPLPYNYENLKKYRPNDINLNIALSSSEGTMNIVDSNLTAHLTDKSTRHSISCTVKRVDDAFDGLINGEVHFCSLDVEGHEENVLKGWNLQKLRPWLFCIESYGDTEGPIGEILEQNDYLFVFREDANIFFVAKEHKDIGERMKPGKELVKNNEYEVVKMTEYIDYIRGSARNTYSFKIGYMLTQPVRVLARLFRKNE